MREPVEFGGFWRRLVAQLIDAALLTPCVILMYLVVGGIAGGISSLGELMANIVVALVVILFWVERRATPGKLVMGLRIIDVATGGTPPVGRLALRYIGYIVSGLPLFLGYLWMLWDPQKQTWHDKMGGTVVVRERR